MNEDHCDNCENFDKDNTLCRLGIEKKFEDCYFWERSKVRHNEYLNFLLTKILLISLELEEIVEILKKEF